MFAVHPHSRYAGSAYSKPGIFLPLAFLFVSCVGVRVLAQCSLPDLPSCACFTDCANVGAPWPPDLFLDGNIDIAHATVGLRSCCQQHGGQAYWQIQKQTDNPACAEALAFQQPDIQNDADTAPEAWCTETVAYWAERACAPYACGYFAQSHHPSSYVRNAQEMRLWYIDEEARGGLCRGRWIDGSELDYANFQPGVNGPCPGAYQQIYKWDPTDANGDGTPWDGAISHSQVVDSLVVYRLGDADGPVQRVDVHMVEGNTHLDGGGIYSQISNQRWYRDIIWFTALGPDYELLDGAQRKIRGWGINLNSDGTPEYDPARISTQITLLISAYPASLGSENSDAAHLAQMISYWAVTGGQVHVSSNSSRVTTGGAFPTDTSPWVIPEAPHPVDPVYIEVDLLAQHPVPVSAITIEWVDGPPSCFEVRAGVPGQIATRVVNVPSGAPPVPLGTSLPFTVDLYPSTQPAGVPVRSARIFIPNSALTRTFMIRGFHYHFYSEEEEDAGGSSPEGDAIATGIGDEPDAALALRLSEGSPNPASGLTRFWFEMPVAADAHLALYDVRGHCVRTLVSDFRSAGRHEVVWDMRGQRGEVLPAGVYFARLTAHGATVTRRLVTLR
ncbi:hypothetical protein KKG45_14155 [bacterium]|nr:hypothetical protein [bacterium]MBU1074381.1 hypothetical protein [bacterium]MBU1675581.1 hypothetical protein [bacterium]